MTILKEITIKKSMMNRLTLKGKTGSFKTTEDGGEVTMTFTLEDGEQLRDEATIAKESNNKVKKALEHLLNPDPDWISGDEAGVTKKSSGYIESK